MTNKNEQVQIWTPLTTQPTQMSSFKEFINQRFQLNLKNYTELYDWSITNTKDFWTAIWITNEIISDNNYKTVIDNPNKMPGAKWFEGATLNFAEHLLRYKDDKIAVLFKGQHLPKIEITYKQLNESVRRIQYHLKKCGVKKGDRVAGIVANMPETVMMMLATTSLGAIWSSCSPDFGTEAILQRFSQIKPKVLVAVNGYYYKDKEIDISDKLNSCLDTLSSVTHTVQVDYIPKNKEKQTETSYHLSEWLETDTPNTLAFTPVEFDHPVYIVYSSGTTGSPKCIVHGTGGVLLQHLKEHRLHCDLRREDKLFYFTTTGWMMWNWLVSGLAVGATLILYEGSPFYPNPDALWELVEKEMITVFGTSASYITHCQKLGITPKATYNLSSCRSILSTGGPLTEDNFDYIQRQISDTCQISSISGGTDILSCFVLGNPMLPVKRGKIQCRGLGMAVDACDESGNSVRNKKGELVCTRPAPSMPVKFWNDPDGSKYRNAYFPNHPKSNTWFHGDYIQIDEDGHLQILGRSDTTLNPQGVRIGTAELYAVLNTVDEIEDSIVVGKKVNQDDQIVLFVQLKHSYSLTESLLKKLKHIIKTKCSPRHVPAVIKQVSEIPYTMNGKKLEKMVKKMVNNELVGDTSMMSDPSILDNFKL